MWVLGTRHWPPDPWVVCSLPPPLLPAARTARRKAYAAAPTPHGPRVSQVRLAPVPPKANPHTQGGWKSPHKPPKARMYQKRGGGGGSTMPHPAQPQHTNYWAPRTRKRHRQEHRPQRPTERSDPTQHAKGRPGDCPGPRKGATTRRNVTRGGGGGGWNPKDCVPTMAQTNFPLLFPPMKSWSRGEGGTSADGCPPV